MLHIFSNRDPSQKLSNPVPSKGRVVMLSTRRHISVLPVSVGSLPALCTRPVPTPRNKAEKETDNSTATKRCTKARRRTTAGMLVRTIRRPPIKKQLQEVAELAFQRSHSTIVRIVP